MRDDMISKFSDLMKFSHETVMRERSSSVVECLTQD